MQTMGAKVPGWFLGRSVGCFPGCGCVQTSMPFHMNGVGGMAWLTDARDLGTAGCQLLDKIRQLTEHSHSFLPPPCHHPVYEVPFPPLQLADETVNHRPPHCHQTHKTQDVHSMGLSAYTYISISTYICHTHTYSYTCICVHNVSPSTDKSHT